jgi:acetyl-CoA synthetase (ADP-forming)
MDCEAAVRLVDAALAGGRTALSEYESKQVLAHYDFPVSREVLVEDDTELEAALDRIGYPLVMKACSADIAHKTERNLVRVDIREPVEANRVYDQIRKCMGGEGCSVLVQEMVPGQRELALGMIRDPQFGPCVMFGLGGIFTEILHDVSFRKAPLERNDAFKMMGEIRGRRILQGFRGMDAADKEVLARMLMRLGQLALDIEAIGEIDINPVIISGSRPVAVDALIVLRQF